MPIIISREEQDFERRMNEITGPQATRRNARWTEDDLVILNDGRRSILDRALLLRRTYTGTRIKAEAVRAPRPNDFQREA